MTTLTMRMIKGEFVVTGPGRADEVQDALGGEGLVQDTPSGLADHRDRSGRQARGEQETHPKRRAVKRAARSEKPAV
jgi:hypothetical protein